MIYGDRVRLRHNEKSDLPRYVDWLNDPEMRAGISVFLPMSQVEEERWFEEMMKKDPIERPFAVDLREGDRWTHVGSCGLFRFNHRSRSAELGIAIGAKERWGEGIGADTMGALMQHGFETLNLNRIFLRVFDFNERAIRLYRSLGFVEEGRLRQDAYYKGKYRDTLLMGMLRTEWENLRTGED
ncbi:MAG: GNAT family protein [Anaerolineales bacterium]